ncbi:class I SAM-dependent methyltransferase [bacterium]|nr:class I SAM-dependent methyltransferase [bacterium]
MEHIQKDGRCPLCNSSDFDVVCRKAGLKKGPAKDVTNVICNRCGLIYNNPMPTDAELAAYYKGDFSKDKCGSDYDSIVHSIEGDKREQSEGNSRRAVEFLRPFLKDGMRILDIGCSTGVLLSEIKKEFPQSAVTGIEPDRTLARVAREYFKIDCVENEFFEDFVRREKGKSSFDLIIMRHVLEHMKNAHEVIADVRSLLSDKGYYFLVFPDAANFRMSRPLPRCLEYGHLYTFTPATTAAFLLSHGMKVVKWGHDHVRSQQILAAPLSNSANSANIYELARGASVPALKRKLRLQPLRHFVFRIARKIKTLARLRWRT